MVTATPAPSGAGAPGRRRRWRGRPRPASLPHGEYPELIARLLALRGLAADDAARDFLAPPGGRPDPRVLPALETAVERLLRACRAGEQVAVYGDFDVDGITATAQLTQALRALGAHPRPYIPDRFVEGYGVNTPAVEELAREGATVLVTADCGTSSVAEVARARELDVDVIVLDHHTTPPVLPEAFALVNPKLPGTDAGGLAELATAGLAFHLAAALHEAAGVAFDEARYLDLAALGTVCDMAPLLDENRRLLRTGLPALAATKRPGLRALMQVSRIEPGAVSADDIGYRLGPRINASGRIAHANLALELLLTEDAARAKELAERLNELNAERQQRCEQAVRLAQHILGDAEPPPLVMVGHADFSSGIVGIIASKLVDVYGRPAVVYELGETTSRASCRSIPEFHITDALRERPDLWLRFGGHRQAAGFSVANDKLEEARAHLEAVAARELAGLELTPVLEIDCQLPLREIKGDEIRWLQRLGPFGEGNPEPTFLARDVTVVETRVVGNGERHVRMKLRDGPFTWTGIAFDMPDAAVAPGTRVDVVYTLDAGRPDGIMEICVQDLRPSGA